jgi:hypothetical protein
MSDDVIRKYIQAAGSVGLDELHRATDLILAAYWPGGLADRTEPAALPWVRRWRPGRACVSVPACACAAGRCPICN